MSTVLFNPTNEDFEGQYIGETTLIPAGEKIKVDDKRGRHLLNVFGPRGLMTLDYGDEDDVERKKAELGRRRNHDFKRTQVLRFNQQNDQRHQQKLPYQAPSEQMKGYADEVGIALIQPYRPEGEDSEKIGQLTQELQTKATEVREKDKEVTELKGEVQELKGLLKKLIEQTAPDTDQEPDKTEKPEETEKSEKETYELIRKQYAGLGKVQFQNWVLKNGKLIPTYPKKNQEEIASMWKKFFKEDLPEDIVKGVKSTKK